MITISDYHPYSKYCDTPASFLKRTSLASNMTNSMYSLREADCKMLANSVDPDQTAPEEQSDLDLHNLPQHSAIIISVTSLYLLYR